MSGPNNEDSLAMQEAISWLQRGDTVRAEEAVTVAAREAKQRFGPSSPEYAAAQNDLAILLFNLGQVPRAAEALREACVAPEPPTPQAIRDYLTYLMNLGGMLEMLGELDEAEVALRQGLAGRETFYGRHHAGYAFGLEPLASLLLRQGKVQEARTAVDEAVQNLRRNGNPRLSSALVLRAEILKAVNDPTPPFHGLEKLHEEHIEALVEHALARIERTDPLLARQVLADLAPLLEERLGREHARTLELLSHIANLERDLGPQGDPQRRQDAIRRVLIAYDRQGKQEAVVLGLLGLALAYGDAGNEEVALGTYRLALERVKPLQDAALRSQVMRNYGLALADAKQNAEAEAALREAVSDAARAEDAEMQGRAEVALGIFLQHQDQRSEARDLLTAALVRLEPASPDAICGRGHLQALETGGPCGCGDTGAAIEAAFREHVLSRLPEGMLEDLEVKLENGDFSLQVYLDHELGEVEQEHLERVIHHALEEFRKRLTNPY